MHNRMGRQAQAVDLLVMAGLFVIGVAVFGLVGPMFAPRGASGPFAVVYLYVGVTVGLALALSWSVVARIRGRRRPLDGLTEITAVVYVVTTAVAYIVATYLYAADHSQPPGVSAGGEFLAGVGAGVIIGPVSGLAVGLIERARGHLAGWQLVVGLPLGLGTVVAAFLAYLALYQAGLG